MNVPLIIKLCFHLGITSTLILSVAIRFNAFSLVYLALLLLQPLLPDLTISSLKGCIKCYLRSLLSCSGIFIISQLIFQIVLTIKSPYADNLPFCSPLEQLLRHLGFVRLDDVSVGDAFRFILPDVAVFMVALLTLMQCNRVVTQSRNTTTASQQPSSASSSNKAKLKLFAGSVIVMCMLTFAGIVRPSVTNSIYFVSLLCWMTSWASKVPLGRYFAYYCRVLMLVAAVHLLLLYLFQWQALQDEISPDSLFARLAGLTKLVNTNCTDTRKFILEHRDFDYYLNPLALVLLYFTLAHFTTYVLSNQFLEPQSGHLSENVRCQEHLPDDELECTQEISLQNLAVNGDGRNAGRLLAEGRVRDYQSVGSSPQLQQRRQSATSSTTSQELAIDTHGSITWVANDEENPRNSGRFSTLDSSHTHRRGSQALSVGLYSVDIILHIFVKYAYVVTNIVMMAWSITFHSALTFVLLLGSCILWLFGRRGTLTVSPFLVMYACVLMCITYIYGIPLTEEELPTKADNLDLKQIGLVRYFNYPGYQLLIMFLFTLPFWLTLRQYVEERQFRSTERREAYNMVVTASFSGHVLSTELERSPHSGSSRGQTFNKVGRVIKHVIIKFWIWAVCGTMYAIAISDPKIYRIIYMIFLLVFLITFMMAYRCWRRLMAIFWLVVILYSMFILLILYIYQFDFVPSFVTNVMYIPKHIQHDIGLEVYDTGSLFVRLFTLTLFIVMTIIQLNYCHRDFLKLTDIYAIHDDDALLEEQRRQSEETEVVSPNSALTTPITEDLSGWFRDQAPSMMAKLHKGVRTTIELIWRFLEIHMGKLVFLVAVLVAVYDVSAVNFLLVLLAVIATAFTGVRPCMSHSISIIASLLLLSKMIYQIDYVNSLQWGSNCTDANGTAPYPFNETVTNAEWMGYEKVDQMFFAFQGYMWLIVVLIVQAVVVYRQQYHRLVTGESKLPQGVLFKGITRQHADMGTHHLLMYLLNYGFYKFGVEVTMVCLIGVIGSRWDVFSVVYAVVLLLIFRTPRTILHRFWKVLVWMTMLLIPYHYACCVGAPPGICADYLWSQIDVDLRAWLYLPDFIDPPEAKSLIAEWILLLLICCQWHVFSLENSIGSEYEGGSNKEIQTDDIDIVPNPVPDFFTASKRSKIEVLKSGALISLFWVTLAVVFMAGVTRISIFGIGYVLGSFVFLWVGNEFYLRPLSSIMKWWNALLAYGVFVVFCKSILQVVGCVYLDDMDNEQCIVIQLLAIACIGGKNQGRPDVEEQCTIPNSDASFFWDGVAFAFLLLQRRFFASFYFQHLMTSMKIQSRLASRGAEIIHEMLENEVKEQETQEAKLLSKIKKHMKRITAEHKKMTGHDPTNHYEAIYSGDYYLFDEEIHGEKGGGDGKEVQVETEDETDREDDDDLGDNTHRTPSQLVKTALQSNVRSAVQGTDTQAPVATDEDQPPKGNKNCWLYVVLVWQLLVSLVESLITFLNKISRDYRYIARRLRKERQQLKKNFSQGNIDEAHLAQQTSEPTTEETEEEEASVWTRLVISSFYVILAHSALACYLVMCVNQMMSASVLSLPLPFMALIWGSMSVPRPSRRFWIIVIAYVQCVVAIKYIFQFQFISMYMPETEYPLSWANILGVRITNNAMWDLLLLLILFAHRAVLKSHGLWRKAEETAIPAQEDPAITEVEEQAESKEKKKGAKCMQPFCKFYNKVLYPPFQIKRDVYFYMVFCDFIIFLVSIFGFSSFGRFEEDGGVQEYINQNRIPVTFLIMIVLQFFLIVVDRAIYIKKHVLAKLILQFLLVTGVHVWMFFVLPAITEKAFSASTAPQIWYIFKCFYFLLSAYQIRSGYSRRIIGNGNFFIKRYNYFNLITYKAFYNIPFLWELRTLMDWVWTDSTLQFGEWFKMEDIYTNVFFVKCYRRAEHDWPMPRGEKKQPITKYLVGGSILALLIGIIWFPLVFFSLGNAVGVPVHPYDVTVKLSITGYQPFFEMTAQQSLLLKYSKKDYSTLSNYLLSTSSRIVTAETFLNKYDNTDVVAGWFAGSSTSVWAISPPARQKLVRDLEGDMPLQIKFSWHVTRIASSPEVATDVVGQNMVTLKKDALDRLKLAQIINGTRSNETVRIEQLMPKFIEANNQGEAVPPEKNLGIANLNRNLLLELKQDDDGTLQWWSVKEDCSKDDMSWLPKQTCEDYIVMIVFNERAFPSSLNILTKGGIIGLYATFVLVAWRFVRGVVAGQTQTIWLTDMPYIDRVLQLCMDIYLVRSSGEFALEEDLFSKLIFLYRSPETMIKWTRPPIVAQPQVQQ